MTLSYTTTDPGFVERAAGALRAAGIAVHAPEISTNLTSYTSVPPQYTLRILHSKDRARASKILLSLGAVQDRPWRLPTGRHAKLLCLVAALILTLLLGSAFLVGDG